MRNRTPKRANKRGADPAEHYTRLADDFGFSRGAYRAVDDGRPSGHILLQPLSLFILSLVALVLVCGVQLWRMGTFDAVFGSQSAVVDKSSKRWMLNGRAARVSDDRVADAEEPDTADEETEE